MEKNKNNNVGISGSDENARITARHPEKSESGAKSVLTVQGAKND